MALILIRIPITICVSMSMKRKYIYIYKHSFSLWLFSIGTQDIGLSNQYLELNVAWYMINHLSLGFTWLQSLYSCWVSNPTYTL